MRGLLGKALIWLLNHPETIEKAGQLLEPIFEQWLQKKHAAKAAPK